MKQKNQFQMQNTGVLLSMAVMIVFAGTVYAGPLAKNPDGAFRNVAMEAISNSFCAAPLPFDSAIRNFLDSAPYKGDALNLRTTLRYSYEVPEPEDEHRMVQRMGFAKKRDLAEAYASGILKGLGNPTPEKMVSLAEKIAALNGILGAYLSPGERERQNELRGKMKRMAKALWQATAVTMPSEDVEPN